MFIQIDEKFKNHKKQFIIQSMMVAGVIAVVMIVMDFISEGVIIASIGASASIAFARPHTKTAGSRYLIGSYIFAIFGAWVCSLIMNGLLGVFPDFQKNTALAIFGAIVVGKTVFLTVVTETEHPPASALALGMLISGFSLPRAAESIIAITIIAILRKILKRYMMNLY
jgi:CBS-domain-containing membrane protein